MTCDEAKELLGEYHDRELDPDRAEAVRAHVASCAACAGEVKSLESLDRALRAAPVPSEQVRWDRYVDRVRQRARSGRRPSWKAFVPLAAVAALAIAFARLLPSEAESRSLLDRYVAATPSRRAEIERKVAALDRESLAPLALAMVADADPGRRLLAARLLAPRLDDPAIRKLLLDRSRELQERDAEETVLIDIGFEAGDEDLVAPALEMARNPAHEADAVRILRRIDRGTLNRKGHAEIVKRLREWLASDLPRDRQVAIRVAGELEILIEDVVEFLDVPELGTHVLEFLRRRTGKDFGRDKDAWRTWFARRAM